MARNGKQRTFLIAVGLAIAVAIIAIIAFAVSTTSEPEPLVPAENELRMDGL